MWSPQRTAHRMKNRTCVYKYEADKINVYNTEAAVAAVLRILMLINLGVWGYKHVSPLEKQNRYPPPPPQHNYYRIAENLHGCKILRNRLWGHPMKFSRHPHAREARRYGYSTSSNFRFVFSWKPTNQRKPWNFAPCESFLLYSRSKWLWCVWSTVDKKCFWWKWGP